jgi:hypothetical protein
MADVFLSYANQNLEFKNRESRNQFRRFNILIVPWAAGGILSFPDGRFAIGIGDGTIELWQLRWKGR